MWALAGTGGQGFADGRGDAAHVSRPSGVGLKRKGKDSMADFGNHVIRVRGIKVSGFRFQV